MSKVKKVKKDFDQNEIFNKASYRKFIDTNNKNLDEISAPAIIRRCSNLENINYITIYEISFNYKFISILDASIEYFIKSFTSTWVT